MQCHSSCSGLVNSAQHFPTSYEGTHACTHAILGLSSNTWHKRMPHDLPFLSVGHSVAHKSRQEMIILSLPRRESFWFSLCQRENLLEAKPVDVRLRRNEGREGKSFSDLVCRKQRLVTAKQFSLPRLRSDSVVRRPWKGAQTSCHQQTTQEAEKKTEENAATNLTKVVWVDARLVASAAMMTRSAPASQLIWRSTCTTRHEHSFWARASRIRYGHIQTKLTFICGFSLNPPPPPPWSVSYPGKHRFDKATWKKLLFPVFHPFSWENGTFFFAQYNSCYYRPGRRCYTAHSYQLHAYNLYCRLYALNMLELCPHLPLTIRMHSNMTRRLRCQHADLQVHVLEHGAHVFATGRSTRNWLYQNCLATSTDFSGRLRHVQLSWTGDFGFWLFHSS